MSASGFRYVYGPVPSRRLGRSLGVDLVPFKTCTYDCVYCQLGRTTCKTVERRVYTPVEEVLAEVESKLHAGARPDYITISGSGEPTLHAEVGAVIAGIRSVTAIPVAVLTNGSLLWMNEVQESLLDADIVIPSLDAGNDQLFQYVNRPHPVIEFEKMVQGLVEFRLRYSKQIWLEVFLLDGVTAIRAEVEKIAKLVRRIAPNRVQLNTVTRPPAESFACPVGRENLEQLAALFDPGAEVIADYRGTHRMSEFVARRENVLDLLSRRPCTIEDIQAGLGLHRNEALKYVSELSDKGLIEAVTTGGKTYHRAKTGESAANSSTNGRQGNAEHGKR